MVWIVKHRGIQRDAEATDSHWALRHGVYAPTIPHWSFAKAQLAGVTPCPRRCPRVAHPGREPRSVRAHAQSPGRWAEGSVCWATSRLIVWNIPHDR